jgi:hypothetical protein
LLVANRFRLLDLFAHIMDSGWLVGFWVGLIVQLI